MQRLGRGRGSVGSLAIADALLAGLAFPLTAGAVLPQQLGSVNLATRANVQLDGDEPTGQAGYAVGAGDVNGDGIDDVIVSAPYSDTGAYTGPCTSSSGVRPSASCSSARSGRAASRSRTSPRATPSSPPGLRATSTATGSAT